jgi:uncharacterized protein involved in copper resistance
MTKYTLSFAFAFFLIASQVPSFAGSEHGKAAHMKKDMNDGKNMTDSNLNDSEMKHEEMKDQGMKDHDMKDKMSDEGMKDENKSY